MIQKTEALVLKRKEFRETSLILTLFTKDFGKINSLVKGIRAIHSKWGSNFSLFSHNIIVFYPRRGLSLITEVELIKDFGQDFCQLDKNFSANYLVELVDLLLPLEDKNDAVFDLLLKIFSLLGKERDTERLVHIFELKLLQIIGFSPSIDSCVKCKRNIIHSAYFSHKWGGLLCSRCSSSDNFASSILPGTIYTLRHILRIPIETLLSRLKMDNLIKGELRFILTKFLQYHLESPLNFYNDLKVT